MNQLTLFAPEPAPARRLSGMPPCVERMWERALAPEVRQEVMAIATARPDEWLRSRCFRAVIDKHDISSCFGHVLHGFVREGLLQSRPVYYNKGIGGDQPGSGHYQGYYNEWRAMPPAIQQ
jgi:hypothetical protein